jgi:hypothetical protein
MEALQHKHAAQPQLVAARAFDFMYSALTTQTEQKGRGREDTDMLRLLDALTVSAGCAPKPKLFRVSGIGRRVFHVAVRCTFTVSTGSILCGSATFTVSTGSIL